MKESIYAALNRVAMLEAEAQSIREELEKLLNVTTAHRFKHGDRVMVKDVDPVRCQAERTGTVEHTVEEYVVVHMDGTQSTSVYKDSQLELIPPKPAPAQPGEWREYPDMVGWWIPYLLGTTYDRAMYFPISAIAEQRLCPSVHRWLRLPDLPPPGVKFG